MGGVKMINHRGKKIRQNAACLKKIQISSYQKAEISSKKSQFKISWLRRVWLHSTVPVT